MHLAMDHDACVGLSGYVCDYCLQDLFAQTSGVCVLPTWQHLRKHQNNFSLRAFHHDNRVGLSGYVCDYCLQDLFAQTSGVCVCVCVAYVATFKKTPKCFSLHAFHHDNCVGLSGYVCDYYLQGFCCTTEAHCNATLHIKHWLLCIT